MSLGLYLTVHGANANNKCLTIVVFCRENALLNERLQRSQQASGPSEQQRSSQGSRFTNRTPSGRGNATTGNRPPPALTPFTPAVLRQSMAASPAQQATGGPSGSGSFVRSSTAQSGMSVAELKAAVQAGQGIPPRAAAVAGLRPATGM